VNIAANIKAKLTQGDQQLRGLISVDVVNGGTSTRVLQPSLKEINRRKGFAINS
jgi:hypothetical protein